MWVYITGAVLLALGVVVGTLLFLLVRDEARTPARLVKLEERHSENVDAWERIQRRARLNVIGVQEAKEAIDDVRRAVQADRARLDALSSTLDSLTERLDQLEQAGSAAAVVGKPSRTAAEGMWSLLKATRPRGLAVPKPESSGDEGGE